MKKAYKSNIEGQCLCSVVSVHISMKKKKRGSFSLISVKTVSPTTAPEQTDSSEKTDEEYLSEWRRGSDEFETAMADIHYMAVTGHSIIEPMQPRL